MSFWFVVKPATKLGNAEHDLMLNFDYIVFFRKSKKGEKGSCIFLLADGTLVATWADYNQLKEKLEKYNI